MSLNPRRILPDSFICRRYKKRANNSSPLSWPISMQILTGFFITSRLYGTKGSWKLLYIVDFWQSCNALRQKFLYSGRLDNTSRLGDLLRGIRERRNININKPVFSHYIQMQFKNTNQMQHLLSWLNKQAKSVFWPATSTDEIHFLLKFGRFVFSPHSSLLRAMLAEYCFKLSSLKPVLRHSRMYPRHHHCRHLRHLQCCTKLSSNDQYQY